MKKIFLVITLLLQIVSFAQPNTKTSLAEAALKGKVKSVREKTFSATQTDNEIQLGSLTNGTKNTFTTYNIDGYQTEMIAFDTNNFQVRRYTTEYDKNNLLLREETFDAKDSLLLFSVYEYQKGHISKGKCFRANGELFEYFDYFYDTNGNLVEQKGYFDTVLFTRWVYVYDTFNRLITKNIFDSKDNLTWYLRSDYKPFGEREDHTGKPNEEQINMFNSAGLCVISINFYGIKDTFEYEFDAAGNWTICRSYRDDVLIFVAKRQITYY
ncbi:MAG: hypothetical protein LBR17_06935 [Bacteroidales bacterium]|jgi:hypothetical protein|nr:hypothetical protein [Bacteroidales bacterium]